MRIIYHHRTLGEGAEGIHIFEMIKAFRNLGHEVMVLGPVGDPSAPSKKKNRLSKIKNFLPKQIFEIAEMLYTFICLFQVYQAVKNFKPDFIYDRYITYNAGCVLAGKLFNIPSILEVNAPLALERSKQSDEYLFFKPLAFCIEKWICANSSKTIVVSTPLAEYFISKGIPKEQLVIMPNGVDELKFTQKQKDKNLLYQISGNGNIIIGFTGVLRKWHGLDLLINSFSKLIQSGLSVKLLIVGDGPERKNIEMLLKELEVAHHVTITGFIDHQNVSDYVNLFDIAVSPKSTFYASPMKVIEYMALAKPVVVANSKNFLDIIDPGENGVVFIENETGSLTNAMYSLYSNQTFREKIGKNARKKVLDRLNWQYNAEQVCKLIIGCKEES